METTKQLVNKFKKVFPLWEDLSFAEAFMEDMAEHCVDYGNPKSFFEDLQKSGVVSGMIGMLVYNSDCRDIYVRHIDDMENFISDMEDEIGEPIANRYKLPHYTFVCWVCYEELAYRIYTELYER